MPVHKPEILAPAGDTASFLAAVAAGADAVYLGLKNFSARMEAANFSLSELAAMKALGAEHGVKLYVAMNVMVKTRELPQAGRLIERLARDVGPDALILQDPGLALLARQAGFAGELHFSTLANVSSPAGLLPARDVFGASRVIIPRECDIDEVKAFAAACPDDMALEIFVHGALCYGVSGRCYWSSFYGGKSGLRGRCVQPCRRLYVQRGKAGHFFSCRDLSLDVLVRTIAKLPQVKSWKIEGRKKGPHYVFHTVAAYKLLRDEGEDAKARATAEGWLSLALGRPSTHARFLPQKPHPVLVPEDEPASGLFLGRTAAAPGGGALLKPRVPLVRGDLIRIGQESEPWHQTLRINKAVPKAGRYDISAPHGKLPKPGTAVHLIDRREAELNRLLDQFGKKLGAVAPERPQASGFEPELPAPAARSGKRPRELVVSRRFNAPNKIRDAGMWLSPSALRQVPPPLKPRVWWWLPPVIWPGEEETWKKLLAQAVEIGCRTFVLGSPWQAGLFAGLKNDKHPTTLWAGPFCNLANPLAVEALRLLGCSGAFVSPELTLEELDDFGRAAPLPTGIVAAGWWPLCVSRHFAESARLDEPFVSPKREGVAARRHGENVWLYPDRPLDLSGYLDKFAQAGFTVLATLDERAPELPDKRKQPSTFNLELQLL